MPAYVQHRPASRGATLVELMVGLAASLLLLSAMATVFANNSAARGALERASQQIENGRFALQLLRDDIHVAGYYGEWAGPVMQWAGACVPRSGLALSAPALGWTSATPAAPLPIYGYPYGDVPAAEPCFTHQKPNTDVLVLRSIDTETLTAAAAAGDAYATDWFLQSSACADPALDPPSRALVVAPGGAAATTSFVLHQGDCSTLAPVRKLVVHAYYIGKCSVCTGSGDGIPSLRVIELTGATATNSSLVEGIESMRVEYALDRDGDGVADALVRCKSGSDGCSISDWNNVIGVQVHLLARSTTPAPGYVDRKTYDMGLAGTLPAFGDGYKRHRFSAMVTAYNRSGPRER